MAFLRAGGVGPVPNKPKLVIRVQLVPSQTHVSSRKTVRPLLSTFSPPKRMTFSPMSVMTWLPRAEGEAAGDRCVQSACAMANTLLKTIAMKMATRNAKWYRIRCPFLFREMIRCGIFTWRPENANSAWQVLFHHRIVMPAICDADQFAVPGYRHAAGVTLA